MISGRYRRDQGGMRGPVGAATHLSALRAASARPAPRSGRDRDACAMAAGLADRTPGTRPQHAAVGRHGSLGVRWFVRNRGEAQRCGHRPDARGDGGQTPRGKLLEGGRAMAMGRRAGAVAVGLPGKGTRVEHVEADTGVVDAQGTVRPLAFKLTENVLPLRGGQATPFHFGHE